MPLVPTELQDIGAAEWTVGTRAGNEALERLGLQHNLQLAEAGAELVNTSSPREYSGTSPAIAHPMRAPLPEVPRVQFWILYEYDGANGDGGSVLPLIYTPAGGPVVQPLSISPSNGPNLESLDLDLEGEASPDYYAAAEVRTAAGKTIKILGIGLRPRALADPTSYKLALEGGRYVQADELADAACVAVDLMQHVLADPARVLAARGSVVLQLWGYASAWTLIRGTQAPASYSSQVRLQHAAPWTSSGKRIRVQVQAWASSAVGGKLVALVDGSEQLEIPITSTGAPAFWFQGWTSVDSSILPAGPHVVDLYVVPPLGGTVSIAALSVYEVPEG